MKEEEIIMYDSPEAAEQVTLTGWVSKGENGRFWYKDEHMARWDGCTHLKCECGNVMKKSWLKCDSCRAKIAQENYQKLPFKEWNLVDPVCERDGDKYFFSEEELCDYMIDEEIEEIDLLFCDPLNYRMIGIDEITGGDYHDDYEPDEELEKRIDEFNAYLKTLHPHSWTSGKVRTNYKLKKEPA